MPVTVHGHEEGEPCNVFCFEDVTWWERVVLRIHRWWSRGQG